MEQVEKGEVTPAVERTYLVRLSKGEFGYLAENLRLVYEAQKGTVQRDGSLKGLTEFYSSRPARLMGIFLDQFPDEKTLPENPTVRLSEEDVRYFVDMVPRFENAADEMLRRQMMGGLEQKFKQAKTSEPSVNMTNRVRASERFVNMTNRVKAFLRRR